MGSTVVMVTHKLAVAFELQILYIIAKNET